MLHRWIGVQALPGGILHKAFCIAGKNFYTCNCNIQLFSKNCHTNDFLFLFQVGSLLACDEGPNVKVGFLPLNISVSFVIATVYLSFGLVKARRCLQCLLKAESSATLLISESSKCVMYAMLILYLCFGESNILFLFLGTL